MKKSLKTQIASSIASAPSEILKLQDGTIIIDERNLHTTENASKIISIGKSIEKERLERAIERIDVQIEETSKEYMYHNGISGYSLYDAGVYMEENLLKNYDTPEFLERAEYLADCFEIEMIDNTRELDRPILELPFDNEWDHWGDGWKELTWFLKTRIAKLTEKKKGFSKRDIPMLKHALKIFWRVYGEHYAQINEALKEEKKQLQAQLEVIKQSERTEHCTDNDLPNENAPSNDTASDSASDRILSKFKDLLLHKARLIIARKTLNFKMSKSEIRREIERIFPRTWEEFDKLRQIILDARFYQDGDEYYKESEYDDYDRLVEEGDYWTRIPDEWIGTERDAMELDMIFQDSTWSTNQEFASETEEYLGDDYTSSIDAWIRNHDYLETLPPFPLTLTKIA